jgi:hypothetical protein
VTVEWLNIEETARRMGRIGRTERKIVRDCNRVYVTLGDESHNLESIPPRRVELSYDHANKWLKFEVYPL